MRILTLLVLFVGCFMFVQPTSLVAATGAGVTTTMSTEQMKANTKAFKMQQREAKATHFLSKHGIDFQDPVNKWMWFWIFGWGAALVLSIVGAATVATGSVGSFGLIYLLASLCGLFGTISLVVWLVKKFS